MQIAITMLDGTEGARFEVADAVFGTSFNGPLVHQVVSAYMSAARTGTRAQKTRAQVRGGGAKPWRQKGTGRARAGSLRSPIWKGGGVTFAARPGNYVQKVNRKMYRGAMRALLSELLREDRLRLVEEISVSSPKTRELVAKLERLQLSNVLIVVDTCDLNLAYASRNLHWVAVTGVRHVNPLTLLSFEHILLTVAACRELEGRVT